MTATVTYLYQDGALVSQTPQPPALVSRVSLGPVSEHARLVLEIDSTTVPPLARAFIDRMDEIRASLLAGDLNLVQAMTLTLRTVREAREEILAGA